MARRKGFTKTRTRTITKFKTRRVNVRGRIRSFRSRHSGKVDHMSLIAAGAGAGAITTTAVQLAQKNGIALPNWASLALSAISGLLVGKHIGHSWNKGVESAIASVATSYIENKVVSGQPILNLSLGSGSGSMGGNVY